MISTSYNSRDRAVVKRITMCLRDIFGQNNIFYDSWSIQPRDGVVDKMNEGLTQCKLFPFFISKNNLGSDMVKLEWQNAIMKMTNGQTKIIPVRLDNCIMPAILLQFLYVDLFQDGSEVALRQIVDAIDGRNAFSPQFSEFSNLIAYKWWEEITLTIECITQHYMGPIPNFTFVATSTEGQILYKCKDRVMLDHSFNPNAVYIGEGLTFNTTRLDFPQNIVPGFPQYAELSAETDAPMEVFGVLHETQKSQQKSTPMFNKTLRLGISTL